MPSRTEPAARSRGAVRKVSRLAAALLTLLVLAAGCDGGSPEPTVPPTPSEPPRAFTVGTTDRITVTDPAAVTDAASSTIAYNVFQRLMTADPGTTAPKPDAARDCRFDTPLSYRCTLIEGLRFHNGEPLTSSDVKFSVERALRLDVPGSSTSMLSSLRRIETPDDLTVRFILSRVDNQFVWALASPAAAIVDETTYDPDEIRAPDQSMIGSGPFQVNYFDADQLQLARFAAYQGRAGAGLEAMVLRRFDDSAGLETAMRDDQVDVVWRGLTAAANDRLANEIAASADQRTTTGFRRIDLPGTRVRQLWWHTDSPQRGNEALREVVAKALQEDRVLDSLVPDGVPEHVASFPIGAGAEPEVTGSNRIQLTLAYDPTDPDAGDQANQIRGRLEGTGGLSVRLIRATPETSQRADLTLVDVKAWTSTPLAWLQPYLDQSLRPTDTERLATVVRAGIDTDPSTATALADLQASAADELIMLPIVQTDEYVFVGDDAIAFNTNLLAPGWQLALWGFRPA